MRQYLLSIYQPDGDPPPADVLAGIVRKTATLDEALEWGRKLARATTLPIEVRPFQGELED
jgi:hypothetical protein